MGRRWWITAAVAAGAIGAALAADAFKYTYQIVSIDGPKLVLRGGEGARWHVKSVQWGTGERAIIDETGGAAVAPQPAGAPPKADGPHADLTVEQGSGPDAYVFTCGARRCTLHVRTKDGRYPVVLVMGEHREFVSPTTVGVTVER